MKGKITVEMFQFLNRAHLELARAMIERHKAETRVSDAKSELQSCEAAVTACLEPADFGTVFQIHEDEVYFVSADDKGALLLVKCRIVDLRKGDAGP